MKGVFYMDNKEGQVYKQFKRLQTARDSREFMQKLINAVDKNKISIEKARTLGYLLKIFLDTVEASEFEERLEELEKIVGKEAA